MTDAGGSGDYSLGTLLRAGGLTRQPGDVQPREGHAWLVDWHGTLGVLRSLPARPEGLAFATDDVRWLHGYLTRLASTGFPAPQPLPCFGGRSWTAEAGALWEIVSYLPGHAVGWDVAPSMEEVGAFLGRYHGAARQAGITSQRPTALPLAQVPGILLSHTLETVPAEIAVTIRQLASDLARDLEEAGDREADRIGIHGDFTNDNVIACGTPPAAAGVIDFALAHVESSLADVGYGLWRSGRPHEKADHLDLQRMQRFVRGYASTSGLSSDRAAVIPLYLRGRGLQMIAKRVRAGRNEGGMLVQVQWLSANAGAISDAAAAAVG